MTTRSQ